MSSSLKTLIHTLGSAGKAPWMYECPDGSRVLALPHGGRVLGLFTAGSDENFYWTHPALESASSAAAFYASDDWQTPARPTWLAPEVDVFLPAFPDTAATSSPANRPAATRPSRPGRFRLVNRLRSPVAHGEAVELEMAKSWPRAGPSPGMSGADLSGVTCAIRSTPRSVLSGSGSGLEFVQMPLARPDRAHLHPVAPEDHPGI